MEGFEIEIQKREFQGRSANNRYRAEGMLPAVVYHRGEESVSALVSTKEFVRLAQMAKRSQIFLLKSDDSTLNGRSALVRDIQMDSVSGKPQHVDFNALKDDEEITVTVPLRFIGEAIGVKTEGGQISIHTHEIDVSCLPKDIPLLIEVSVTELRLNAHLHAEDIILPSGVALEDDGDLPIVSVSVIREEVVAAAPAADAAAATPAAGAAAPAAGAADKAAAPAKDKK